MIPKWTPADQSPSIQPGESGHTCNCSHDAGTETLWLSSEIHLLKRILSEIPDECVIDRLSFENRLAEAEHRLRLVEACAP